MPTATATTAAAISDADAVMVTGEAWFDWGEADFGAVSCCAALPDLDLDTLANFAANLDLDDLADLAIDLDLDDLADLAAFPAWSWPTCVSPL